jgi:putative peptidoglycan lipid II flippase
MISNTDITLNESQSQVDELEAEVAALEAGPGQSGSGPRGSSTAARIAGAALLLTAGTILSRIVGVGRESSIAYLFGAGTEVDAFTIANNVVTIVYDLLLSGAVSAALVPVFSEYANNEAQRVEFGKVVSTVLTVAGLFLGVSVFVLELLAEPLVHFMGVGYSSETQQLALVMTQWVLPAVLFMGLSGVVMAAHYALNRFVFPAFTSVLFNAAIIFCAFSLTGMFGIKSLALGLVVGAFAMLAFQLPGLRDVSLRPTLALGHPAVRKILKLYAPVAMSVMVSSVTLVIDRSLASQVGDVAISAMRYATTLVQFGLGIVAAAISIASLPTLSQHFTNRDSDGFRRTLSSGLRLVTVLVFPAAAGLMALSVPLVGLIFRNGTLFGQSAQDATVLALLLYVVGLPFSAIDQVLLFAFYARKNTVTPALIGIAQFGVYLSIAFATYKTWGMSGLVIANSAQLAFHAIVTGIFLLRAMRSDGGLRGYGIGSTGLKALAASLALGVVSFGSWWLLSWWLLSQGIKGDILIIRALLLGIPALLGGSLYLALVWLMRLPEVELILAKVRTRISRRA